MDFESLGFVNVAAASLEVSIGDPLMNAERILTTATQMADAQVSIGVFPELCITGYSAEDLFFSDALLSNSIQALQLLKAKNPLPLIAVGLPWRLSDGRLLNCAALLSHNTLLGLVPKTVHPNYGEFYDLRWFVSGANINESILHPTLGQFQIRCDQLFELNDHLIGVEICEDMWAPDAPSTRACLAGAEIILNLSASNELIAKADYRRDLVRMSSAKNICAYIYASAGPSESTKDVVFGGHCLICESGQLLKQNNRFALTSNYITCEVDTARLRHDRASNTSFSQASRPTPYRVEHCVGQSKPLHGLQRRFSKHPFVPDDEHEFEARAEEILSIQATGLARRMQAANSARLVIGLSGGLDSTLAFLVCLDALKKLDLPSKHLIALTMPGPGTTKKTYTNAHGLAEIGAATLHDISIQAAVEQHLRDLKHGGEHDIVFENAQARERTQLLFNFANKVNGIVVGTGDLSELALGWCTYNADHMASYNVNSSVPKTMMAYLVRWYAHHRASTELSPVLESVLSTPISPELIPPAGGEISQRTEAIVGPYELHDYFMFHFLRTGASPTKIYYLACLSFAGAYSPSTIKHWLNQFFSRFMHQQFKRTTLPPGPKVGSISLSPRGDWRMPDEASVQPLLKEIEQL